MVMDIKELIKSRRTIRKFKQEPIASDKLAGYIDCARVAPSAANLQPLKYITVSGCEMAEKMFPLVKFAGYLAPDYNPKDGEHPTAYIVICADKSIRETGYDIDVGAATANIILSALADGIGTCWMAAIDREAIHKLLELPENLVISCVLAMGYPSESPKEVEMTEGNVKYYLEDDTLCVPKRSMDEILVKTV